MSGFYVAPFSNSDIRDWPADRFRALVGLLVERTQAPVHVIGAPNQRLRADAIVRPFDAARVVNACGRLSWGELRGRLAEAACVVGNNSGVCHLAAALGAPTVCVFSGSHPRRVWRPLGPRVVLLSRAIGCSPCGLHHAADCPYALACLREIEPEVVAQAALDLARPRLA